MANIYSLCFPPNSQSVSRSQFKTYLCHSVVSLKKALNKIFHCLIVLASSSKFQFYFYKTKKQKKDFKQTAISWRLQKQVRVIVCPAGQKDIYI